LDQKKQKMNSDLGTALTLLLVGMVTVFAVLTLVVLVGQIMIGVVNRWMPVVQTVAPKNEVSQQTMAVLAATVDQITAGKGRISNIEKL
jgi:oxaloacetate decarboxylase gamma subunit